MMYQWLYEPATNLILVIAIGILATMVSNARRAIVRRLDHIVGNIETILKSQAAIKTTEDVLLLRLNKIGAGPDVPPV
jgi:hypothetical protein